VGDLNLNVFRFINGWSDEYAPFWRFFSEAANQLWFKIAVLILVVAMVVRGLRSRRTVLQALIAWPIANGMTDLFKHFLPEPRPFQDIAGVALRGISSMTTSHGTASAHAANMAAIAVAFTLGVRWWGSPWVLVALLTGISRIYVGAHYPYQVLLGWTCGIVAGLLVFYIWRVVEDRVGKKPSGSESAEPDSPG
jgi:undecaprenyl-diphosphatase